MKNLLIILCVILVSSCAAQPTPLKKAEKLIKQNLFETQHDFGSYELISFGKLDSAFSEAVYDINVRKAFEDFLYLKNKYEDIELQINKQQTYEDRKPFYNRALKILDTLEVYENRAYALNKNFIPKFIGWQIDHKFRSKTKSGNFRITNLKYIFDKEITKISRVDDLDDLKDKK